MREFWFWQRIVSPHMAVLAAALARIGGRVTYVAEQPMSADRAAQGWQVPDLPGVALYHATNAAEVAALVARAPVQAMHLCQGVRGNGMVSTAQRALARRGVAFWIIMETVDDTGLAGFGKRLLYRSLFLYWHKHINGVLAIGQTTVQWIRARGLPAEKIFPFAYFLKDVEDLSPMQQTDTDSVFRFVFVGRLIELKRLGFLMDTLAELKSKIPEFSLQVIGSGPLEDELRAKGQQLFGHRLQWLGQRPMQEVRQRLAAADCLVLPSRHDGWGAVVSEALMAGTPAICSDRCGAAEVVIASGVGGVFKSGDQKELAALLAQCAAGGRQTDVARATLAQWAQSLGAKAGADYLMGLFAFGECSARPIPPWRHSSQNQQRELL